MKFTLKNISAENAVTLMRRIGYFFLTQEFSELSFIRPMDRNGYPRFHIYLKFYKETDEVIFNLHLDQKRPVYKGVSAHSGEYDGETIEREAERIKKILGNSIL